MRRAFVIGAVWLACAAACSGYGSATDAPPDASPGSDAARGDDGGTDGGADDASRGPFCASKSPRPFFCSDFDLSRTPIDGWSYPIDYGADGSALELALDDAGAYSPPLSFRVGSASVNPGFSPGINGALARQDAIPATTTAVHFEAKIHIEAIDRNRFAWLVVVRFGASADSIVILESSQQGARIGVHTPDDAGGSDTLHPLQAPVPVGAWTRLSLDFTFAPSQVEVRIGSAASEIVPLGPTFRPGMLLVEIGEQYYENVVLDATSIHYDDVLVDLH